MKAGTTYLYATLSTHPLLLNTLRGKCPVLTVFVHADSDTLFCFVHLMC